MKWVVRILIALVALAMLGFVFRKPIGEMIFAAALKPGKAFADYTPPPEPDYTDDASWVSLPGLDDPADETPEGLTDNQAGAEVAVFFVHPTTYINKASWNAPLDNKAANDFIAQGVMRAQASAFNGCCAIYAPRYRQATFYSFSDQTGSGEQALALAYSDVTRAFEEFLSRIGERPFILAAHSQGSLHLGKLLGERVSGTPLAARLVAAYPVGIGLNADEMAQAAPDIPVCETATQTQCYVSWNAMGAKAAVWDDLKGAVCVNPLSWDTGAADASSNKGAIKLGEDGAASSLVAGVTGAQCQSDRLLVGPFQSDIYDDLPMNLGRDNYHILDYSLFYADVRENAVARTDAFMQRSAGSSAFSIE